MHLKNLENIDVFVQFYQIATRENFHPCDQASIYGMHSIQMVKFLQLEEIAERQKKRVATDIWEIGNAYTQWWVCLVLHSKLVSVGLVCCTL